jgi:hypothetical protein
LICINAGRAAAADKSAVRGSEDRTMTTGNVLYLLMVVGMFMLFCAVLAYESWQQSRQAPETVHAPAPDPHHGVTA